VLPIVDADGHLDELPDEIMAHLDPPLRDQIMISRTHGLFPSWLALEHRSQRFLAGHQYAGYRLDPTPDKWLAFADRAGIEQAVLYPTAALSFGLCGDPDVAAYLARAYNNWAHSRYTSFNARLQCVALLPLQSVPAAVTELRRIATELQMPAALLPATELPLPLGDETYWPLYAEAERLCILLGVHGGHLARGRDLLTGIRGQTVLTHPVAQIVEMTGMVMGGVFETFPRLKVAYLEAGCGWVPYLMDRLDEKWAPGRSPLKKPPSAYLRDCPIYVSAEPHEHALPLVVEMLGADHLFCASDFPHEMDADGFVAHLEEWRALDSIADADKRQILVETARAAYSLAPLQAAV
jgi:predicted TIM-barrel fold metal-dependent hydrolase